MALAQFSQSAYSSADSSGSSRLEMLVPSPQSKLGSVSVVIVVWNAKAYVLECLESLIQHCSGAYTEVIIVDNASTDGTPELIERRFPEFTIIRNTENLGFAKANNIGIQHTTGEYVCLVNSDVKFTSDCFSPMLEYFAEHPEASMLGPQSLWPNGEVRRSTMRFPTVWNNFCRALGLHLLFKKSRLFGGLEMSEFNHLSTRAVEVLVGWFVVARRSAINRVGLLDPQFFIYGEDVDWCYRFHQCGEKVVFFADAEAVHYGGASSSNAPLRFYLEKCYSEWQYWRKHYGRVSRLFFITFLIMHHSVRVLGCGWKYLRTPASRSETRDKIRRSLVCLKWLFQLHRRPLEMAVAFEGQDSSSVV